MGHDEGSNPGSAGRWPGSPPVPEAEFEALCTDIAAAIGADGVSRDPDLLRRHASDWSGIVLSDPRAVIRPRTTEAVAAVLRLCNAAGQAVVVQGGRTGLAGGDSGMAIVDGRQRAARLPPAVRAALRRLMEHAADGTPGDTAGGAPDDAGVVTG